jgi:hypothetical protein
MRGMTLRARSGRPYAAGCVPRVSPILYFFPSNTTLANGRASDKFPIMLK